MRRHGGSVAAEERTRETEKEPAGSFLFGGEGYGERARANAGGNEKPRIGIEQVRGEVKKVGGARAEAINGARSSYKA